MSHEYWAGTDMVYQCLIDQERVLAFHEAIIASVKPGDVVVDLGTGTGILSMFAVEAGAKKVYAVEADNNLYQTLELNLTRNGFKDKVALIKDDARNVQLPEKVDVVICEMIATGLIDELQIPVMNNIQRFCKKNTRIIPAKIKSFAELIHVNDSFYGHQMKIVQYEYGWNKNTSVSMTEKHLYSTIDFTKIVLSQNVDHTFNAKITQDGTVNAIRITNETFFSSGSVLGGTSAYCMPLILPLDGYKVKKGDSFLVNISYNYCTGFKYLKFGAKNLAIKTLPFDSRTKRISAFS